VEIPTLPVFRPTPTTRKLLFALLVALLVLGLAEGLARLLGDEILRQADSPPLPPMDGAPMMQGNPYLLWELAPGTRKEMNVTVTINRLGLRGPEWTLEKPPGVRRIMALGDSSVFGLGVEDHQVFTSLLDDVVGDGVQVINAAVPGYSTYQAINLLQIRGLSLQPDVVLVACLWSDNNTDWFVDRELLAAYSSFRSSWARALRTALERLAFYRLLDYQLRVARGPQLERKVGWLVGQGEIRGERRVPINEYAENLETIAQLAHEAGAEVMYMILPNTQDLRDSRAKQVCWDPYRRVMRDTALRHGAPLIDLPKAFLERGGELFHDDMHPNVEGHRLMAAQVHAALADRDWLAGGALERNAQPGNLPWYDDPFELHVRDGGPEEAQVGVPGAGTLRLAGTVRVPDYAGGGIKLEVITTVRGAPKVVGSTHMDGPGSFETWIPEGPGLVYFALAFDEDDDGHDPQDRHMTLAGEMVDLRDARAREGIVLQAVLPRR